MSRKTRRKIVEEEKWKIKQTDKKKRGRTS
jgi:hypothetical protein